MKTFLGWTFTAVVALGGMSRAQSAVTTHGSHAAAQATLVGAWHLAWLDEPGPDGKIKRVTDAKGSLIYTADGVVSVQVMYAQTMAAPSNAPMQYAVKGYEASFGRYVVDTAAHTVTHHYEGSLVRPLIGQDLPRRYELVDGRLIIRSTRPDEHWSVGWERPTARAEAGNPFSECRAHNPSAFEGGSAHGRGAVSGAVSPGKVHCIA